MKRIFLIATFAFAMTFACVMAFPAVGAPAFAATIVEPGTSDTTMTYTVASTYSVTISDSITIAPDTKTGSVAVGVNANALIPYQTSINVKLSDCDFTLTNGDDNITYTIGDGGNNILENAIVLAHAAGNLAASSKNLSIVVVDGAKYSGAYSDTITFAVSVDANA